jgi:hypothetical protein
MATTSMVVLAVKYSFNSGIDYLEQYNSPSKSLLPYDLAEGYLDIMTSKLRIKQKLNHVWSG